MTYIRTTDVEVEPTHLYWAVSANQTETMTDDSNIYYKSNFTAVYVACEQWGRENNSKLFSVFLVEKNRFECTVLHLFA